MIEKIKALAASITAEVIQLRRHIHENPELSFQEVKTARYIADQLDKWHIAYESHIGGNGIVALIEGNNPKTKMVCLRADMDALPIQEKTEVTYASKTPGVMHACGHDVHTASLLGTSFILKQLATEFEGSIRIIFQPGEELSPGGASLMIDDGVLTNPTPSSIVGQHVYPILKVGQVGFRSGKMMASSDEIEISFFGKGGHGALPHLAIDPILIAAHCLIAAQQIVSRKADPILPTVLNFGHIHSWNGTHNVIPEQVDVKGTFRTFDEHWRSEALSQIKSMIEGIAQSMGGKAEITIKRGYPFLINDAHLTSLCRRGAEEYLGSENVFDLPIRLTSEDFAFYTHHIPGCFYRLGTNNDSGDFGHQVHSPFFNIDEEAFSISTGLMAWLAIKQLLLSA
jgi:amidohydrolase